MSEISPSRRCAERVKNLISFFFSFFSRSPAAPGALGDAVIRL